LLRIEVCSLSKASFDLPFLLKNKLFVTPVCSSLLPKASSISCFSSTVISPSLSVVSSVSIWVATVPNSGMLDSAS